MSELCLFIIYSSINIHKFTPTGLYSLNLKQRGEFTNPLHCTVYVQSVQFVHVRSQKFILIYFQRPGQKKIRMPSGVFAGIAGPRTP